jgi:hypothetical protein
MVKVIVENKRLSKVSRQPEIVEIVTLYSNGVEWKKSQFFRLEITK